ncbi:apolipoprotein N-acyltransferase [Actinomycetota bacterium]
MLPDRIALLLPLRLLLAVLGGLALWLAFPGHDLWWLAPVAVTMLSAATLGARPRLAAAIGLVFGLCFFVPTLSWSGIFVGRLPWFALATLQALYLAAMSALLAWVQLPLLRRGWAALAYAAVPLGWALQELSRGSTPWGGFPWARLAFSQADSPLASLASLGGAPLVTMAVAAAGAGLHAALAGGTTAYRMKWPAVALACVAVLAGGSALVPLPTDGRSVRVGLVQGNVPRAGLDFNAERRKVLDNHVEGTVRLAERAKADGGVSLVVWPENSSDIDPLRNADARVAIDRAVGAAGVPVVVGAVLDEPAPNISNASLLFRPDGSAPERYVKQHPVPFAEYIPYRDFFRMFSDKVDYVTRDFTKGTRDGAFRVDVAGQAPYWAIPTICFEVAYDGLMRSSSTQAGRTDSLLLVQTNNATFGYTDEAEQQFAISRIRAIEHGRSVAHVSTVGVSALIRPDGTYGHRSTLFTADQIVEEAVIRSQTTLSDRIGPTPEVVAALLLLGLGVAPRVRRRGALGSDEAQPQPKETRASV